MNKVSITGTFENQIKITEESVKNIYRNKCSILHWTENEIFCLCNHHFSRYFFTKVGRSIVFSIKFCACLVFLPDKAFTFNCNIYDSKFPQP